MKKVGWTVLMLFIGCNLYSQNYQLHAVYMYQFTKYIKWPDTKNTGDFVIGVLGESPATEYLQKMADAKKVGSRNIILKKYSNAEGIGDNHMLFIGKNVIDSVNQILPKIQETNTLLITEEEGFGLEGSNINFVERNGRLVFELNQNAMRREDLRVSSELSRLAIVL